jgi:hypothetical protein
MQRLQFWSRKENIHQSAGCQRRTKYNDRCTYKTSPSQNIPLSKRPTQNVPSLNVPRTKRPTSQNVPLSKRPTLKTSHGTKRPKKTSHGTKRSKKNVLAFADQPNITFIHIP